VTYWYGLTDIQAAAVHAAAEAMGRNPGELAEELLPLLRMDAPDVPIDPEYAEEVLPEEIAEELEEPQPVPPETAAVPVVKPDLTATTELTVVRPPLDPPTDEIPVTTNPLPVAKKEVQ